MRDEGVNEFLSLLFSKNWTYRTLRNANKVICSPTRSLTLKIGYIRLFEYSLNIINLVFTT